MLVIALSNLFNGYITILIKEWRVTNIEFKTYTANSPNINTPVIFIF